MKVSIGRMVIDITAEAEDDDNDGITIVGPPLIALEIDFDIPISDESKMKQARNILQRTLDGMDSGDFETKIRDI